MSFYVAYPRKTSPSSSVASVGDLQIDTNGAGVSSGSANVRWDSSLSVVANSSSADDIFEITFNGDLIATGADSKLSTGYQIGASPDVSMVTRHAFINEAEHMGFSTKVTNLAVGMYTIRIWFRAESSVATLIGNSALNPVPTLIVQKLRG